MKSNTTQEQPEKEVSTSQNPSYPPNGAEIELSKVHFAHQDSLNYAVVNLESPKNQSNPSDLESAIANKPYLLILIMALTFTLIVLFALFKGGEEVDSLIGIQGCSTEWGVLVAGISIYCVFAAGLSWYIARKDIIWKESKVIMFLGVALFGGIASGLLGIGGGLIVAPLLLEMGLIPEVTSASSSFLVLFTSSSTSVQFMIHGMLNLEYASVLFFISVIASFIGVTFINRLVKKYNRPSIIVFTLGILIGLSALLLPLFELTHISFENTSFGSVC